VSMLMRLNPFSYAQNLGQAQVSHRRIALTRLLFPSLSASFESEGTVYGRLTIKHSISYTETKGCLTDWFFLDELFVERQGQKQPCLRKRPLPLINWVTSGGTFGYFLQHILVVAWEKRIEITKILLGIVPHHLVRGPDGILDRLQVQHAAGQFVKREGLGLGFLITYQRRCDQLDDDALPVIEKLRSHLGKLLHRWGQPRRTEDRRKKLGRGQAALPEAAGLGLNRL
jgi:hypothetical protein